MRKYLKAWLISMAILLQSLFSPVLFKWVIKTFNIIPESLIFAGIVGGVYLIGLMVVAGHFWIEAFDQNKNSK